VAWSIVGISAVVEVTGTAHALTEPAGVASGDLLIACISSRIASTTPITIPAGWTAIGQQNTNNVLTTTSAVASGVMAYIIRGGSAPALSFTHPTAPSVAIGRIVAYRNSTMALPDPWDQGIVGTTAVNTTAVSFSGFSVGVDGELMVAMVAGGQEAAWSAFKTANTPSTASGATDTTTAPSTTTWIERADTNTATGGDTSLAIFDAVKATKGATGNITCTASLGAGHALLMASFFGTKVLPTWTQAPGSYALTGAPSTILYIPRLPADVTGLFNFYAAPVGPYRLSSSVAVAITPPSTISNQAIGSGTTNEQFSQSFKTGASGFDLVGCTFQLAKTGAPTDNLICDIYAADAGLLPTGSALGSSSIILASSITSGVVPRTFEFSTPITLSAATSYCAVVRRSGTLGATNFVSVRGSGSDVDVNTKSATRNAGVWGGASSIDFALSVRSSTPNSPTYYAVGGYAADNWYLIASKATEPRGNWANIGTQQLVQTGAACYDISCFRDGNVLHIAACTNHVSVCYITFDMATETWGTMESVHANFDPTSSTSVLSIISSIVVRSDDSVVVAYQGPRASTFSRVGYKIRDTASVWGTYTELSAAGSVNYTDPEVILGASDRVHFMHRDMTIINPMHRNLPLGGSLSTATGPTGGYQQYGWNPQYVRYDAAGTIKIFSVGWDAARALAGIYFDSGATPTINLTTTSLSGTVDSPTRAFVDGTDIYVIYNQTPALDLYVTKSTDHGASFSGSTLNYNSTAGLLQEQRGTWVLSQNGEVYIRGSNYVVPYFVQDVGQTKIYYNEYTVRSTSNNKVLTATPAGGYALVAPATPVLLEWSRKFAAAALAVPYALVAPATPVLLTYRRKVVVTSSGSAYGPVTPGVAVNLLHKIPMIAGTPAAPYLLTGATTTQLTKGGGLVNKTLVAEPPVLQPVP
jgi:hypothetical protein